MASAQARTRARGPDVVLCLEQFKMQMVSQSCLMPGLFALVHNLVCFNHNATPDALWESEYFGGAAQQLFRVPLAPSFAGADFALCVVPARAPLPGTKL